MKLRSKPKQNRLGKGGVFSKPAAFHYSSYRMQSERQYSRGVADAESMSLISRVKKLFTVLPYLAGFVALILSAIYILSLSSDPQLVISGKKELLRDKTQYYYAARDSLSSSLANRNKLTIKHSNIENDLKSRFPELRNVEVSTPLFLHRPRVEVTLARPAAVLTNNGKDYLIDNRGIALFDMTENPVQFDATILPRVNDQTNFDIKTADHALTSNQINYITEVVGQADAKGLKPEYLNLLAGGGELHVKFQHLAYFVKFNFYEDARKSVGTYLATREYLEREKQKPKEYIDVRVPERAYVR